MADVEEKKGKKPVNFRISDETAEKLRELSKDFVNQDYAFNALMAAFERENMMNVQPQFAEDIKQVEQYLRLVSLKYSDALNALSNADERARVEVQALMSSKDMMIQSLQEQMAGMKADKEKSEALLHDSQEERRSLEEELVKERLAGQGLEAQMREKESRFTAALNDKDRLNEVLTTSVREKQEEVDRLKNYAEEIKTLQGRLEEAVAEKLDVEQQLKDARYREQAALLEQEKQFEQDKEALRRELEEKASKRQERDQNEIENLRNLLAQAHEQLIGTGKRTE